MLHILGSNRINRLWGSSVDFAVSIFWVGTVGLWGLGGLVDWGSWITFGKASRTRFNVGTAVFFSNFFAKAVKKY